MADIKVLSRLIGAIHRDVDLQQNSLVVGSLKVGSVSPTELTKAIVDRLVALQNGSDLNSSYHTHDNRYSTETELASTSGTSGAELIGVKGTPANHTPATADAQGYFDSIDSALATAGGTVFLDSTFRITDDGDPSRNIAFEASAITIGNTRVLTMPDANVDLGSLTNSNIDVAAAIAYTKLNLSDSILDADINSSAAISYSKLNLSASIVDGDINGSAAIAESKLALDYSTASLFSGKVSVAGDVMSGDLLMGVNKVTSSFVPDADNVLVNKLYVDGVVAGALWLNPIIDPNLVDDSLSTPPATPEIGDTYIAGDTATGDWAGFDGYAFMWNGTSWVDLLGRAVIAGDRFGVIMESISIPGGGVAFKDDNIATIVSATPSSITYTFQVPLVSNAVYVNNANSYHTGHQYDFTSTGWVEFGGLNAVAAGVGLYYSSNTLNVNMGAGIAQLPSDEVGVDVHVSGGLMTTVDNSSSSTGTAAQLAIKLDGSTLSKGSSGLKVAALGITDSEISASAAIAYSKLNLSASIVDGDINGSAAIAYSKLNLSASIVDGDINAAAAIAYSKLNLSASIVNADIDAAAAIAYSKLDLSNSVTASDITTGVADQSTITGGNGTALSVSSSPVVRGSEIAGETFAASLFAVRFAKAADAGFVAGRVYKADIDASVTDNFYVVGLVNAAASAAGSIVVTKVGPMTVTGHGFTIGAPLFLDASGAITATPPPSANSAVVRVGFAKTANIIEVQIQVIGVA